MFKQDIQSISMNLTKDKLKLYFSLIAWKISLTTGSAIIIAFLSTVSLENNSFAESYRFPTTITGISEDLKELSRFETREVSQYLILSQTKSAPL